MGRLITSARGDLGAVAVLVAVCLGVFAPHLVGESTFIGNSDRLDTFLNVRLLEVRSLQESGRVPAWDEATFMGTPTFGFHWMTLGVDPIAAGMALLPAQELFRAQAFVAAAHTIVAAMAAYLLMRDVVRMPFAAMVGAGLYVCSAFAIHRISQVDSAFAVQIFAPLGIWVLRKLRPGRVALCFLGLAGIVWSLMAWTFLQDASYVLIFFGLYACFLSARRRDWRPILVLGAAGLVGLLVAAPRLGTVVQDILETSRSSAVLSTCPCEVLRWFDDGIFGRYPQEALALGNSINLHEGNQLYTSTFAAFLLLAGLLRPRGTLSILAGGCLVLTLVVVARPIVEDANTFNLLLVLVGSLVAWALLRPAVGGLTAMPRSPQIHDPDVPFYILFVALAFAIMLSDEVRYWIYILFMRFDFSHARISAATLLPVCLLSAIAVRELFGNARVSSYHRARSSVAAVAGGSVAAMLVLLLLDPLSAVLTESHVGSVQRLPIGTWIYVSTPELGRIAAAGALTILLLTANWLAQHVKLVAADEGIQISWRRPRSGSRSATLRLMPAYLLGCLVLFQGVANAYFQVNGSHTRTYPDPFLADNSFTAPIGVPVVPDASALAAVRERLETEQYRSVVVSAPDGFPTYDAATEHGFTAYVAELWRLRVVGGYPALPRRLAELPWPEAVPSLRSLNFRDQTALPWNLLAALNVKYALIANPPLLFNVSTDAGANAHQAGPNDFWILENPLPVTPRAFFAHRVVPATETSLMSPDPSETSAVAGIEAPRDFASADGSIQATYAEDRVHVSVTTANVERFLVLNELYHPGWHAYAGGTELNVWPTNAVMRGIVIPAGVTEIELRFVPFFLTPAAWWCVAAGVALAALTWWVLWQLDRQQTSLPLRSMPRARTEPTVLELERLI